MAIGGYSWSVGEARREHSREDVESLDFSLFDVFVSHKQEDANPAIHAAEELHAAGLSVYLDLWDPAIDGVRDLESRILTVITDVPALLAVITDKTKASWWVPFETGAARATSSQIASYLCFREPRGLPIYLDSWPKLASDRELRGWAEAYKRARLHESPETITLCMQTLSNLYTLGDYQRMRDEGLVEFSDY